MTFLPNKLLLNVLACGLILTCPLHCEAKSSSDQKNWTEFTSQENGFSVELPTQPEHVEQTIDVPRTDLKIHYDTYISEPSDSVVYVISVWNYPSEIDMSKPEVNLQDGFGGMLSALPGSEVKSMQMTEEQDYKALDFLVKNDEIFFQGKLILVYNTLYQVFVVYKDSVDMKEDYEHFIDSFKLLQPEKRKLDSSNATKMNV